VPAPDIHYHLHPDNITEAAALINYPASTFTWKGFPFSADPYYKYPGGFVGKAGQLYHVRLNLVSKCEILNDATGDVTELFMSSPCRSEYTIASRNLFQVPGAEFRYAFSRERGLHIALRPSDEEEDAKSYVLAEHFQEHSIDIRELDGTTELTTVRDIVQSTLANDMLNARCTYKDAERGLTISIEYPINLINLNVADDEFQVCTGPVILPDLATWDGHEVTRVFQAHAAFTRFDRVEFILRREVEAADYEKEWLEAPIGLDRLELIDPNNQPPGYPPARPKPTTYHEVWDLESENVVLRANNN
jgi:hypothetical protein